MAICFASTTGLRNGMAMTLVPNFSLSEYAATMAQAVMASRLNFSLTIRSLSQMES